MHELLPFSNEDFSVRVVLIDGEPWWVAKDVCDALGLTNVSQAMAYLDEDEKTSVQGGVISNDPRLTSANVWLISEAGLYSLILRSRKPEAKTFKRWVTHDIIPSVRKTGSYSVAPALTGKELLAAAVLEAQATLAAREERILELESAVEVLEPKGEFYDELMSADGTYSWQAVADIIRWQGKGRNHMMEELRRQGIVQNNNLPYSSHMKYFKVIPRTRLDHLDRDVSYYVAEVRPIGIPWLRQRLQDHTKYKDRKGYRKAK